MYQRLFGILVTWPFLCGLAVLLANDWWLKAAYPSFVTGKLSDFTGVAIVALLLLTAYPKRRYLIYAGIACSFFWWKSAASTPLIDFINGLGFFRIGRTVDYGDLWALSVLPVCQYIVERKTRFHITWFFSRELLVVPVAAATLVAVMGTSVIQTRQEYMVRPIQSVEELKREEVAEVIKTVALKHGLNCRECARPAETATYAGDGIHLMYSFASNRVVEFKVEAFPDGLFFGASGNEKANALRASLKNTLAEKFKGLEYVEQLQVKGY